MSEQMPSPATAALPAVPVIRLLAGGAELVGARCEACGNTMSEMRRACPKCGARDLRAVKLAEHGVLREYTVVHRTFPGIPTPFIAAVVELDGGGALQGTLIGIAADPAAIAFNLPVQVVFRDTGQRNKDGKAFIGYVFKPLQGASADA